MLLLEDPMPALLPRRGMPCGAATSHLRRFRSAILPGPSRTPFYAIWRLIMRLKRPTIRIVQPSAKIALPP